MASQLDRDSSNGAKTWLHNAFVGIERMWDRVRPRDATPDPMIDAYTGYGTPDGCVLRGRILDRHRYSTQIGTPSRLNAVRNMARNFFTDEMPGVRIVSGDSETVSDEEGYFQLLVPSLPAGSQTVQLRLPEYDVTTEGTVLVPAADATLGIISDIDDTILKTGAYWLPRNLWTTATTFISDREVFKDTIALLQQLRAGINPVFYVSSSPWNLHAYLNQVFATHDVPEGPLFLRDLGISETKFIKSSHGSHKGDAIDTILAANPSLDFVLVGDSGQHDASVYHEVIKRHPGRIRKVVLRTAGEVDDADRLAAQAIAETGVDIFTGADLSPLLRAGS